jgi:hypothetical protein
VCVCVCVCVCVLFQGDPGFGNGRHCWCFQLGCSLGGAITLDGGREWRDMAVGSSSIGMVRLAWEGAGGAGLDTAWHLTRREDQ